MLIEVNVNLLKRVLLAAALVVAFVSAASAESSVWRIDPTQSKTRFRVKHMMVATVTGSFAKTTGSVAGDPSDPTRAQIDVSIDAASIDTGSDERDDDLRSEHFFNVAKYPAVTFRSKSIRRNGAGLTVVGDLTMRGVTRPVMLDVNEISPLSKAPDGTMRIRAEATGSVNRKEFGMTWNKSLDGGGVLVSDEVTILINVALVKNGG